MKRILSTELFRRGSRLFRKFGRDTNGNIIMIFGLFLVPLFLFVGAALDYTRALDARTKMQSVADVATIAATKELLKDDVTAAQAEAIALSIFNSQINTNPQSYGKLSKIKPTVTATKTKVNGITTTRVEVGATAEIALVLASAVGDLKLFDLGVRSVSENTAEGLGALSMYFVLDRSGSMGWTNGGVVKLTSLKTAMNDLLNQLKAADPDKKYVRTGSAAYNTGVDSSQAIVWGTKKVSNYTAALTDDGGTNTSSATTIAVAALKHKREVKKHYKKNEQVPKKFMLLMTDGDNNQNSWDTDTLTDCTDAKNNGIEVYAVAFAAPSKGKTLLKNCASSIDHYFDASQANELIAAFKEIGTQVAKSIPRVTN